MATTDIVIEDVLSVLDSVSDVAIDVDPTRLGTSHTVTVAQVIAFTTSRGYEHFITVSELLEFQVDPTRAITDSLDLGQSVVAYIVRANANAGHGETDAIPPATQVEYDALVPTKVVSFAHASTSTVTLRAPIWGNKDKYEVVRIQEETRGKMLVVYQDPMWPKTQHLELEFDYMSRTQADELLIFIKATLGKNITYTDHFGQAWVGFITSPDAEFRQIGRNNISVELTFQGVAT